ncbi:MULTISPECIES: flagellar filament capping protein FliD [unclassified Undibacterium]|uniref:flagellar filament capping protein FliD n=1 Tax=unclassified Undibacterium TaxID=2630295 RepID=UPI002AC8E297|nr:MULTISPECIES: flagellar filament capping protein FliD [unclassified Undibacterium]MEB0139848.1 flagellar filament capping protein FliD [Undibacterium sp. CCC2.1]MEB0172778.1 flagellar filament capping protein FliD [Undibacterium sp. CCC1.1]MEB0176570.1 flagellar filament capping protein FliD [Undibacterium sp. CCC3.4]MEB0215840.1 flagellar filament capping protein FliD [Undibacterium sp. 5I2]WPX42691.1 flagellar filament capping protein FliD [Undibacterium sp. CCC3.4]
MAIQSTGIGSGLDVTGIVSKLMQLESAPLTTIQKKQTSYNADLTAYGTLSSAVSSFQSSLTALANSSTFKNLTATSGDSSVASATTTSVASAGSYSLAVTQLAQAQSISSAGQVSSSNAIGSGTSTTISFQFGAITGGTATGGVYTGSTFTQDASNATGTITIDSTNNSLQGIRDAINTAALGVSASIVGDGSATPYHLVLASSTTGANSSMKISASSTGDAAVQALFNYDPGSTQNFTEITSAQSAKLTINGIAITSATNSVSSSVQGMSFNVAKVGSTTITVAANKTAVQSGITAMITAYNNLTTVIGQLTSYNATTKTGGALLGDPTTRTIQNQLRTTLGTAVNGTGGGFTSLAQIGITFQKDGTLAADSTKLTTALNSNFGDIGGLFASMGKSNDSLSTLVGSSSATQAGNYAVNITQIATQGLMVGNTNLNSASTTIAAGTTIGVTLDGVTANVSLPAGSYNATQFATMLQSSINGSSGFSSGGLSVVASIDTNGFLNLQSASFGSTSSINLANSSGTLISAFSGTVSGGTNGKNVAGSFNGVSATGKGQILTGSGGSASEGLQLLINGGSTGSRGSVNFSQGYAYQLNNLTSSILSSTGTIASATKGINSSLTQLTTQTTNLNARLALTQARLMAQYSALDTIISSAQATTSFLTQQIGVLNGTTSK